MLLWLCLHKKKFLSFDLIYQSFEEKFIEKEYSFFETKFLLRSNKDEKSENLHRSNAVILPGIIAYLYFLVQKYLFLSQLFC